MISDELRPIVTQFVVEMLNDPRCESILLDTGEDAILDSDLPVIYVDVIGNRYEGTLSIVGGEYSVSVRNSNTNDAITTVRGRGAWRLQQLLDEIKTKLWEDK